MRSQAGSICENKPPFLPPSICRVTFGRKGKILRNVYLPKDNGETSEIDVLYITQKGIFVFESKNYSGWIFGDEKGQYWTAMLPNRQKNRFYNPIKQESHACEDQS